MKSVKAKQLTNKLSIISILVWTVEPVCVYVWERGLEKYHILMEEGYWELTENDKGEGGRK